MIKTEFMNLYEELNKLNENKLVEDTNAEAKKLAEDIVSELPLKDDGNVWYTEYFAVGPGYEEKASGNILTIEDFDYEIPEDLSDYNIVPIVFGPHFNRTYSKEKHNTLDEALNYVMSELYSDSDLAMEVDKPEDLFEVALVGDILDNSATFIVAYGPDVQDDYGCYIRVSQKPLNSNRNLGKYYLHKSSDTAVHLLAELMDNGIMEDLSSGSNFDFTNYAWQAK